MWFCCFVIVFLPMIQAEADRAADARAYANRTLQSYCPYMNFCHRNATRQPDFIDDEHGPCCLPCSCDDDCVELENCCPDKSISHIQAFPLACKKDEVKSVRKISYRPLLYRVVDKCPKGERNQTLVKKCKGKQRTELIDYIWVSDSTNGKIFQNRYCAYCHGVDKFKLWNVKTHCEHAFPSNIKSYANLLMNNPDCNIINVTPDFLAKVNLKFRCIKWSQSICEKMTTSVTLLDACTMYSLPVLDARTDKLYKNIYCRMCVDRSWDSTSCFSIDEYFDIKAGKGFTFVLDFRNLNEAGTDRSQCDVDSIFDTRSSQCLKLRCPLGKVPYKGECKTFLLPTSHLTLTAYYYLQVQWEDKDLNRSNSTLNATQIGIEVKAHFMNISIKYNKQCSLCTLDFKMVSTKETYQLGDFIFNYRIGTTDMCPLETLQVDLLGPVDKQIAVKIEGDVAMTINLRVSLITKDEADAYRNETGPIIRPPCIGPSVVLQDIITCPQVEITGAVIQSITDYHLTTTLGLLFKNTAKVGEHDTEVIFMCVNDYFDLPYVAGIAVRLQDSKVLALVQTTLGLLFNNTAKVGEHDTAVIYMCVDDYFDLPYVAGMAVRLQDSKGLALVQAQVENGTIIKQTLDDEVDNTSDNKMDNTTLWITLSGHDTYYIPAEFNLTSSLSNQTDEDEYWQEIYQYNTIAYYLSIVVTSLIIVLNLVVIWLISRRDRLTRLYCHLLNLAIADLGAGLLDVLPTTIERANDFAFYIADESTALPFCKIQRCVGHMTMVASNYILATMSIDRADVVTRPMSCYKRGRLMQWCSVLFCWVIGLVFSIPHAVLSRLIGTPHICEIYFETDAQYWWRVFFSVKLVVVFIIPLLTIIISYTVLLIGIYRRGLTQPGSADSSTSHTFNRRLPKSKIISLKLTFGIILSFVICWTPHFVIGALQVYGSMDIPPITIFMVLYYLNSVANPIMFFVFHYKKQESVARRTPSSETHLSVLSSLRQRLTLYGSSSNLNGSCKSLNIHQQHNNKNHKQCLLIRPEKVVFH